MLVNPLSLSLSLPVFLCFTTCDKHVFRKQSSIRDLYLTGPFLFHICWVVDMLSITFSIVDPCLCWMSLSVSDLYNCLIMGLAWEGHVRTKLTVIVWVDPSSTTSTSKQTVLSGFFLFFLHNKCKLYIKSSFHVYINVHVMLLIS